MVQPKNLAADQSSMNAWPCRRNASLAFGSRSGLAPLEIILVLPLLMLVMAMIVAFGYAATWRIRAEVVSRDVVWRNRGHRNAQVLPGGEHVRAREWPEPGRMQITHDSPIASFDDDSILDSPIIAGAIPEVNVNAELLNFSRSVDLGHGDIIKQPPLLPRLGQMDFRSTHPLVSDGFQYDLMLNDYFRIGAEDVYSVVRATRNDQSRLPFIYEIGLDYINTSPGMTEAITLVQQIRIPKLLALDEDQEFADWYGFPCGVPDFHPQVNPNFSSFDKQEIIRRNVQPTLNQINRVAVSVARGNIRLYQDQADAEPRTSPRRSALEAIIKKLKNYVRGLGK